MPTLLWVKMPSDWLGKGILREHGVFQDSCHSLFKY